MSLVQLEDECLRLKHCKLQVAEGCELTRPGRDIAGEAERRHQPCAPEVTAADPPPSSRRESKTEDLGLRGASRTAAPITAIQRRECRPQARLRPRAVSRQEGGGTAGARRLGNPLLCPGFSESPKSGNGGGRAGWKAEGCAPLREHTVVPAANSVWRGHGQPQMRQGGEELARIREELLPPARPP